MVTPPSVGGGGLVGNKMKVVCFTSSLPFFQSHNDFVAILDLPEGEHQYKFFVDGQWVHDASEVQLLHFFCLEKYFLTLSVSVVSQVFV